MVPGTCAQPQERLRLPRHVSRIHVAGGGPVELHDESRLPRMQANIDPVPPREHDHPMIDGALPCVQRGQARVAMPFVVADGMAPVCQAGGMERWTPPGAPSAPSTPTTYLQLGPLLGRSCLRHAPILRAPI